MDWKQLAPGLAIGGIALYAIAKLAKSGGSSAPSVYNALVPTSQYTPENRDAARVSAFSTVASVGLAQIAADTQKSETASAIDLAKARFANQLTALGSQLQSAENLARINNDGLLNRLTAEITDRQYDRELQQRAIDQTYALAQTGQIGNAAGNILGAILGALNRGQQSRGGQSGGGSGSGGSQAPQAQRRTIPQMSVGALQRLQRNALLQAIFGGPDPTGSGPIGINPDNWPGFADPGGFWDNYGSGYDPSALQSTLDWWSDLNGPQGYVTSDFEYLDFFSGGVPQFDRSLPVWEPTFDEWYADYGWQYDLWS